MNLKTFSISCLLSVFIFNFCNTEKPERLEKLQRQHQNMHSLRKTEIDQGTLERITVNVGAMSILNTIPRELLWFVI